MAEFLFVGERGEGEERTPKGGIACDHTREQIREAEG
jgi:hypothetical protein